MAAQHTFPTTDDLTHLSLDDARRVLRILPWLIEAQTAQVSRDAQTGHWQVVLPITGRVVPLAEWANEWLTMERLSQQGVRGLRGLQEGGAA